MTRACARIVVWGMALFLAACGSDGGHGGMLLDAAADGGPEVFVPDGATVADGGGGDDGDATTTTTPEVGAEEEVGAETAAPGGGGCAGESYDGRCEGTRIVYCESPESGPAEVECAPEHECAVVDGYADCRLPGSAGCGRVTFEGYCEGDVAVWCDYEITEVVSYDCGDDGQTCGYIDDELGYYCVAGGGVSDGPLSVSGAFFFEKPALGRNGLGAVSEMPVRNAIVQVRRTADDELVGSGQTDEEGAFTVAYDEVDGQVYALALAAVDDGRYAITVRDCPLEDCGGSGYVHAVYSEDFTPSVGGDIGGWVASREGSAGAFNIFDVFMRGQEFATRTFGSRPPLLTGQWERGSQTTCGELSCFSPRDSTIFVLGLSVDTDEFDDPVLAHEFGHYLAEVYSRSDSPGGDHDGSPTDPRLAWDEGYGTFAGCELMGSPLYIDTGLGGASVTDISDTGERANPNGSLKQQVSEYLVAEVLWTLSRGGGSSAALGSAVIFDVLAAYFPTDWLADRGVPGVDLVDFLDGLMCRGNADQPSVRRVVVDERGFPYDFLGPGSCR